MYYTCFCNIDEVNMDVNVTPNFMNNEKQSRVMKVIFFHK